MNRYANFLVGLSNQLKKEGKYELADEVEENWDEFLKLLESGELNFDFTQSSSPRGTNTPNRGREVPACAAGDRNVMIGKYDRE